MLHACFSPFALCFVTLRGVFMNFPELTYWRDATVPVPCFLLFLCFEKAKQEIFSELDETKPEPPIFRAHKTMTEGEPEGGQGSATPRAGAPPCPHKGVVWPPWPPSDATSPLYKAYRLRNPKSISNFPVEVPQLRRCHRRDSGDSSLCSGTLSGWGSTPGAISIASIAVSIDFTAISTNVVVSHDEEGVVLPRD
jgi:hypothetical protein